MPWYKIEANTGPGHQSYYLEYVWRDEERLNAKEKCDLFEDTFRDRDAVGSVVVVRKLPAEVRDRKIEIYKRRLEDANRMLTMLTSDK